MSKATVTIMTCDRCAAREEIKRTDQEYNWGRIHFAQVNGPIWIGSQYSKPGEVKFSDICPACVKDVSCFWESGKVQASHD